MATLSSNPVRQIGIITDMQQGIVNAIVPLPGLNDGLVSVAKDLSLRIWMRREQSGHFYPSACIYLRSEGTSIHLDKSGAHIIVGTEDGSAYRFSVSSDFTILSEEQKYIAHVCPVLKVLTDFITAYHKDPAIRIESNKKFNLNLALVFTLGASDKTIMWFNAGTGKKLGLCSRLEANGTAVEVDVLSRTLFVGMANGKIQQITIDQKRPENSKLTGKWSAHDNSPISSFSWFSAYQALISSTAENWTSDGAEIKIWFIGGGKGRKMVLCAHAPKVAILHASMFVGASNRDVMGLVSVTASGEIGSFSWKNSGYRQREAPAWEDSNNCQLCRWPFIWNVTECWRRKIIGRRQHHCRFCGKAICGECWNPHKKKIPVLGFEEPVNMCKNCYPKTDSVSSNSIGGVGGGFGSSQSGGFGGDNTSPDPLSVSGGGDSRRLPAQTVEVRGFEGFDDEPLGMSPRESTTNNKLQARDEDLLGLAINDDKNVESRQSKDESNLSTTITHDNNNLTNSSKSSSKSSHGETIFSRYKIVSSGNVVSSNISYEKQWVISTLNDCSIRIFDISDLIGS